VRRWLAPALTDEPLDWAFHWRRPRNFLERKVRVPDLALMRAARESVKDLREGGGELLVSLDPRATYWCSRYAERMNVRVPHVAYGFNFATLPTGLKRRWMAKAFGRVDRFVVYSEFERGLYARYFGLPESKFEVKLWGVGIPETAQADRYVPAGRGDFICALGGNRRDYRTLMAAMRMLPDVQCVAVVRPHNLAGLDVPANVTVCSDIPHADAMGILERSRFMALPLEDAQTPCGHVTMVAAMRLGKAFVVTRSAGVADYVEEGSRSLSCEAKSPESLAAGIRRLWDDPALARAMGENGRAWASRYCSEESMVEHFRHLLQDYRLLEAAGSALA
jgi:glycosyltransferase involved in cell wall biosynthesis